MNRFFASILEDIDFLARKDDILRYKLSVLIPLQITWNSELINIESIRNKFR